MQVDVRQTDRTAPDHLKSYCLRPFSFLLMDNGAFKIPERDTQPAQTQLELSVLAGKFFFCIHHEGERIFCEHILRRQVLLHQLTHTFFLRVKRENHRRFHAAAACRAVKSEAIPDILTAMGLVLLQRMPDLAICFFNAVVTVFRAQFMDSFNAIRGRSNVGDHRIPCRLGQIGGIVATVPNKSTTLKNTLGGTDKFRIGRKRNLAAAVRFLRISMLFKRRQRIPRQIRFDHHSLFGRIALVIERTGNAQHSGKVCHRVEFPAALHAQPVGMLFIALHDPLNPSPIFFGNRNVLLQKPVGVNAVAAMNNDARRAFQTMQKRKQFLQRFWEVLLLVRRSLDVVLLMDKRHAADLFHAGTLSRRRQLIHQMQAEIHILRLSQTHGLFQHPIHAADCKRICRIIRASKQIRCLVCRHALIQFGHEFLCIHSHHPFLLCRLFVHFPVQIRHAQYACLQPSERCRAGDTYNLVQFLYAHTFHIPSDDDLAFLFVKPVDQAVELPEQSLFNRQPALFAAKLKVSLQFKLLAPVHAQRFRWVSRLTTVQAAFAQGTPMRLFFDIFIEGAAPDPTDVSFAGLHSASELSIVFHQVSHLYCIHPITLPF